MLGSYLKDGKMRTNCQKNVTFQPVWYSIDLYTPLNQAVFGSTNVIIEGF